VRERAVRMSYIDRRWPLQLEAASEPEPVSAVSAFVAADGEGEGVAGAGELPDGEPAAVFAAADAVEAAAGWRK
jgi:hypothetical protein